jgi:predicted nucleic acid-binding protein
VKPVAVLDSSVVVSGIGWSGGEARRVLVLLAQRGFTSVRTGWLAAEWSEVTQRVSEELRWGNPNWPNWLDWLRRASVLLDDPPRKRIVRRDPKDDPVVAAAVWSGAQYLVAYDRDLLDLGKPYGVSCVTPRAFLAAVLRA